MTTEFLVAWRHSGERHFEADYQQALQLRMDVFVAEQGFVNEADEIDQIAYHLLLTQNGSLVATARVFTEDGVVWQIGRVAVAKQKRGAGFGKIVIAECEKQIKQLGGSKTMLGAQQRVQPFYEACGYHATGEPYDDEFCPHIHMEKVL